MSEQSLAHPAPGHVALWAGRVLSALPVALLAFSAFMKITHNPQAAQGFEHFGYSPNLLGTLGAVELGCAVLYAIPRTAVLGAILATGYLGGAVATHVRLGEPMFVMAIILGVMIWAGLYLRDPRVRALVPLR